jgi:hypothetical protein
MNFKNAILFLFCSATLLVSCGQKEETIKDSEPIINLEDIQNLEKDPAEVIYIANVVKNDFTSLGMPEHKTKDLIYFFGDIDNKKGKVFGSCFYQIRYIVIDRNSFKEMNFATKKRLLAHELGHCAFDVIGHHENKETQLMKTYASSTYTENQYQSQIQEFSAWYLSKER